jgi:cellulose synthase (UDP-forming)
MIFTGPLIVSVLLLFFPEQVKVTDMILLLPGLFHLVVVYPLWHRNPYRLEAWATRVLYSWSHVFAIWDVLRRRAMGWQPTGSGGARRNRTRRLWIGIWAWTVPATALWIGAAVWRMDTMVPEDFALPLASGLFYAAAVLRVLVLPRPEEPEGEADPAAQITVPAERALV